VASGPIPPKIPIIFSGISDFTSFLPDYMVLLLF